MGEPNIAKATLVVLLVDLARVVATKSSNHQLAADLWRRVLSEDPSHREGIAALEKVMTDQKDGAPSRGKQIATVGAAMIAVSIILGLVGVSGALMHHALQFGGIGLGVVGIVMWRVLKK